MKKYAKIFLEVDARKSGLYYSREFEDEEKAIQQRGNNGRDKDVQNALTNRNIGDAIRSRIHRGQNEEYSLDIPTRQTTTGKRQLTQEEKIVAKTDDLIYKWHGNIGKDRFDVDKHLNSFINLSKTYAKTYSLYVRLCLTYN